MDNLDGDEQAQELIDAISDAIKGSDSIESICLQIMERRQMRRLRILVSCEIELQLPAAAFDVDGALPLPSLRRFTSDANFARTIGLKLD